MQRGEIIQPALIMQAGRCSLSMILIALYVGDCQVTEYKSKLTENYEMQISDVLSCHP
jgi:hypothetical protein